MSDVFDSNPTIDTEPLAETIQGVLDGDVEVPKDGLPVGDLIEPKAADPFEDPFSPGIDLDSLDTEDLVALNEKQKEKLAESPSGQAAATAREAQAKDAAVGRQIREQMAAAAAQESQEALLGEFEEIFYAPESVLSFEDEETGMTLPSDMGMQVIEKMLEQGVPPEALIETFGEEEWDAITTAQQAYAEQQEALAYIEPLAQAEAEFQRLAELGDNHVFADAAQAMLTDPTVIAGMRGLSEEQIQEGVLAAFLIAAEIENTNGPTGIEDRAKLAAQQSGFENPKEFTDYLKGLAVSDRAEDKLEHQRIVEFVTAERPLNLQKLFPNVRPQATISEAITSGDRHALRRAANAAAEEASALLAAEYGINVEVVPDEDDKQAVVLKSGPEVPVGSDYQKTQAAGARSARKAALKRAGLR